MNQAIIEQEKEKIQQGIGEEKYADERIDSAISNLLALEIYAPLYFDSDIQNAVSILRGKLS